MEIDPFKNMGNRLVLLAYCIDNVTDLVAEAEGMGLLVEVLVKESAVFDVIRQHDAKYVVGVCCPPKIASVTPYLDKMGVHYRAVRTNNGEECFKQTGHKRSVDMQEYTSSLKWLAAQD